MKNWYESKVIWAMVIQSLISILLLAQEWYTKGDFSIPAIIGLAVGVLVIVLRVWFTDTAVDTPKARAKEVREAIKSEPWKAHAEQYRAEQGNRK